MMPAYSYAILIKTVLWVRSTYNTKSLATIKRNLPNPVPHTQRAAQDLGFWF
ncbi:MAG: hypothetical protein AAF327_18560 [Cyanobacteria bacterium P01_A01_bin.37]